MTKIGIDQFAILGDTISPARIDMVTSLGFGYSLEGHRIAVNLELEFSNEKEKMMLLKTTCEFEIASEDWDNLISDNKLVVPKTTLEYFAMQTVGTSRGILFCKTEGTPFSSIIVPPIDVTKLVPNDMNVDLPQS